MGSDDNGRVLRFQQPSLVYNPLRTALLFASVTQVPRTGFFQVLKEIMSDAHHQEQSFIRTPKQLILVVAGFFLVIVLGIILLVTFVTNKPLAGAGAGQTAEAVTARIRPVAEDGFVLKDANAPKVLKDGLAVYGSTCVACHGAGVAGAPKVGDAGAWSARIAQGYDTLRKHAIEGLRAMPAKGGNPDLDDVEVARAVVYMSNQSGAKFKEPEAPAAGAQPAAAAPAAPPAPAPAAPVPAAPTPAAPASASADVGKTLYGSACIACHGGGIAGAPKFGDKAAWAPRIAQGAATLHDHAIKGFQGKTGMMPPKGGASAPDADVKAAVDYMVAAAR
jgi:cytochrome c5